MLATHTLINPILCFGEHTHDLINDALEVQLGRFLPILHQITEFNTHTTRWIANSMIQLAALYCAEGTMYSTTEGAGMQKIHLTEFIKGIGKLLAVVITLDEAIEANQALKNAWQIYQKMVKYVRNEPEKVAEGVNADHILSLESLLEKYDLAVFNQSLFWTAISTRFEAPDEQYPFGMKKVI
jgi:hypothetical protein